MANVVKHPKAPVDHTSGAAAKPKLLDKVCARIRRLNYSIRTEDTYVDWVRWFVLFQNNRRPHNVCARGRGLTDTSHDIQKVSASTKEGCTSVIGRHHDPHPRPEPRCTGCDPSFGLTCKPVSRSPHG